MSMLSCSPVRSRVVEGLSPLTEFLENIMYFGFALEVHLGLVLPDPRYIDWEGAVCQM